MNFGTVIRNLRVSNGMSQYELAQKLGTSQSSVTAWENGKRQPDFASLAKISELFGVPMSMLVPSKFDTEDTQTMVLAQSFSENPKLKLLFDRSRYLSEKDLDAVLQIVNAITRERGE